MTACAEVEREIKKHGKWNHDIMLAIAKAENTTCDPLRHNMTMSENHGVCVGSYGVLQVGCLHYRENENPDDLATNVKVAYRAWTNRQKWGNPYEAWTQYTNGTYKEYLK